MYHTGFYRIVTQKEAERRQVLRQEEQGRALSATQSAPAPTGALLTTSEEDAAAPVSASSVKAPEPLEENTARALVLIARRRARREGRTHETSDDLALVRRCYELQGERLAGRQSAESELCRLRNEEAQGQGYFDAEKLACKVQARKSRSIVVGDGE